MAAKLILPVQPLDNYQNLLPKNYSTHECHETREEHGLIQGVLDRDQRPPGVRVPSVPWLCKCSKITWTEVGSRPFQADCFTHCQTLLQTCTPTHCQLWMDMVQGKNCFPHPRCRLANCLQTDEPQFIHCCSSRTLSNTTWLDTA